MPNRKHKPSFKPSRKWTNAVRRVVSRESETKMLPTSKGETTLATSALVGITDVSTIIPGTESNARVGQEIKGFGLNLKLLVASASTQDCFIRIAVVSCDEDQFTSTSDEWVIDTSNLPRALMADNNLNIMYRLNKLQYKILYERLVKVSGSASTDAQEYKIIHKFIKFNHRRWFNAGTGDSKSNNLRLIVIPIDAAFDAATSIEYTAFTQYFYKDM